LNLPEGGAYVVVEGAYLAREPSGFAAASYAGHHLRD
jgi:hypothetical protein